MQEVQHAVLVGPDLLQRCCQEQRRSYAGEYDTSDMYEGRRCKENAAASVLKGRLKLKKSKDPEYTKKIVVGQICVYGGDSRGGLD